MCVSNKQGMLWSAVMYVGSDYINEIFAFCRNSIKQPKCWGYEWSWYCPKVKQCYIFSTSHKQLYIGWKRYWMRWWMACKLWQVFSASVVGEAACGMLQFTLCSNDAKYTDSLDVVLLCQYSWRGEMKNFKAIITCTFQDWNTPI